MSRIEYKAVNNNSIVIYKRGGYRTVIPLINDVVIEHNKWRKS